MGLPPMYGEFVDFLPKKWTFNSRTMQNVMNIVKNCKSFGGDFVVNDAVVRDFVDHILPETRVLCTHVNVYTHVHAHMDTHTHPRVCTYNNNNNIYLVTHPHA